MSDTELPLSISCRDCAISQRSIPGVANDVCDDCLVTFLCGPESHSSPSRGAAVRGSSVQALVLSAAEVRTVRLLQRADMAPRLRHTRHLDVVC